jgi:hypothetical protein
MRTRHQRRGPSILAWERHEEIGRMVAMRLKPEASGMISDEPVGELLAAAKGVAADPIAAAVAAAGAKRIEQGYSVALLSQDRSHHVRRTDRHHKIS